MRSIDFLKSIFVAVMLLLVTSCQKNNSNPPTRTNSKPPAITSINPAAGAFGTVITITGTNFNTNPLLDTVKFNGVIATIRSVSPDSLVVIVPKAAGPGQVTVTVGDSISNGIIFNFNYTVTVSTFAGSPEGGYGYVDGPSASAVFATPSGMAFDSKGNLYLADNGDVIRKISTDSVVSTVAGGPPGYIDGPVASARFGGAVGVAVDKQGNIFVSDNTDFRIRKITPAGMVSTFAGSGGFYMTFYALGGYVDGPGSSAMFSGPWGMAIDTAGTLYVADMYDNAIRKITPDGMVSTLAGNGTAGYKDGDGATANFNQPISVAVDKKGNVYVADAGNYRIRKIDPSGKVSTLAGNGISGYTEGPGTTASFKDTRSVAVDANGNVYVCDTGNERIRKITPDGLVSTLAGTGVPGSLDGPATDAWFFNPGFIAVDASGNVFVADDGDMVIRKITIE